MVFNILMISNKLKRREIKVHGMVLLGTIIGSASACDWYQSLIPSHHFYIVYPTGDVDHYLCETHTNLMFHINEFCCLLQHYKIV